MKRDRRLSTERARELLAWDDADGIFRWAHSRKGLRAGSPAGSFNSRGRWGITIDGWSFELARVAWLWFHGSVAPGQIQYRDGNRKNLRPENLYATDRSMVRSAETELTGATYMPAAGKWQAQITRGGRTQYLGRFDTAEEAHEAWLQAKNERSST